METVFILVLQTLLLALYLLGLKCAEEEKREISIECFTTTVLVIIPVHNESSQLTVVLESLNKALYPENLKSVVVLADRCNDNTVEIARSQNVEVYEDLDNEFRTKAGVLSSFFNQHMKRIEQYDYICIIDADTVVDNLFFVEADSEFKRGHRIVQAKIQVHSIEQNMLAGFMKLYQSTINVLFFSPLFSCKQSVILAGKGMLISTEAFQDISWKPDSLIEDVDISYQASIIGVPVYYSKKMVVSCTQPCTFRGVWRQQRRWLSGQMSFIKHHFCDLVRGNLSTGVVVFMIEGVVSLLVISLLIVITAFTDSVLWFALILYLFLFINSIIIARIDKIGSQVQLIDVLLFPFLIASIELIRLISFFFPVNRWV